MSTNKSAVKFAGLTSDEASRRLKQHGANVVIRKKRIGPVIIFLGKFKNPLLLLLIAVSAVSFLLGHKTSAAIVLMMVFLSATLDFINSFKSQKAVDKLISRVSVKVAVIRDGKKREIDIKEVVPGDFIFLSAGDIVPADGEVVLSDDFFVNESALTGESMPVEKAAKDGNSISESAKSENRVFASKKSESSMAVFAENKGGLSESSFQNDGGLAGQSRIFMGTSVVSGYATVMVKKTGAGTEFGKIAKALAKTKAKTDMEVNITKFSVFIMKLVVVMASIVVIIYLVKNAASLNSDVVLQAFIFALAITIGITPDILPAIMTICLAKGSQLMAKKAVIVKQLNSIENFGSMDILCTDKTGTLTQDRIALVKYVDLTGAECEPVLRFGYLSSYYHTGVANPLDGAIKEFKHIKISGYRKVDEIPYDFERKRSSMVVDHSSKRFIITKGAPEEIFKICKLREQNGAVAAFKQDRERTEKTFKTLSEEGFRVLALCQKALVKDEKKSYERKEEKDMTFLGFLAFLDPPKEGIKETIDELEKLGISVKIITGDNELLAKKICRDIDLEITGISTGSEIDALNDLELEKVVLQANIFARVKPEQKERIILALKRSGKAVGYLGDGINDAPALRAADVGISVNNAVDIAKDSADIILMRKSLKSLKDGVIEGRKTFRNTLKYLMMGLSSNFGNMFSMMGAAAFLPFLPMLPPQILLNNFIYDVAQFSLPTDDVDADELLKPAHWDLKFIRSYMVVFGWISSIFDFLTFFLLYSVYRLSEHQFQTGWFMLSIATQVFVIYVIRTKKLPFIKSRPSRPLLITTILAVIVAWIIPYTFIGKFMLFQPLPLAILGIIAGYVIVYLALVEIGKRFFYRYYEKKQKKAEIRAPAILKT